MGVGLARYVDRRVFCLSDKPENLTALLARLAPGELLLPDNAVAAWRLVEDMSDPPSIGKIPAMESRAAVDVLMQEFGSDGVAALKETRSLCVAAGQALAYVQATQFDSTLCLRAPMSQQGDKLMGIDAASLANLEVLRTQSGETQGSSLLAAIDLNRHRRRRSRHGVAFGRPLGGARPAIERGLTRSGFKRAETALRAAVRATLKALPDMARALTRLAMGRRPAHCLALGQGLIGAAQLAEKLATQNALPMALGEVAQALSGEADKVLVLAETLDCALVAQPPLGAMAALLSTVMTPLWMRRAVFVTKAGVL